MDRAHDKRHRLNVLRLTAVRKALVPKMRQTSHHFRLPWPAVHPVDARSGQTGGKLQPRAIPMISDHVASALSAAASVKADRRFRRSGTRATGEPLTLGLIAVSILVGISLAIACSYRPVALWWVMVGSSAISVVRLGAELSRKSRSDRAELPAGAATLIRGLTRLLDALAHRRSGPSKASLDRQHTRFLVWFTEHNLLWTLIGFGASLLLWHRFGPTTPALVVMAALMSCAVFAALGATVGASSPTLGLCCR